jgi:hypothetical protein
MPIDPGKFKKIVTNHFDNLSEGEFLKTLHKSSPYLFDGSLEAKRDVPLSDRDETPSLNIVTNLSPISSPGNSRFIAYLREELDRMKSGNTDSIFEREVMYSLSICILRPVIKLVIYLTEKTTKRMPANSTDVVETEKP